MESSLEVLPMVLPWGAPAMTCGDVLMLLAVVAHLQVLKSVARACRSQAGALLQGAVHHGSCRLGHVSRG